MHQWADEDIGSNVGERYYSTSGFVEKLMHNTRKGYELAFILMPKYKEYYQLINGEYEYVGEE